MLPIITLTLLDEKATEDLAQNLAHAFSQGSSDSTSPNAASSLDSPSPNSSAMVIFLKGELGSGKTTFVRYFLRGLNFVGSVKSPTFTLVEEYDFAFGPVYHFDLYRLAHPTELEFIGIREYFAETAVVLVEWPERGKGVLQEPDLILNFKMLDITTDNQGNSRQVSMEACSDRGKKLIDCLKDRKNK